MLIEVNTTWTVNGGTATGTGTAFDTTTFQIVAFNESQPIPAPPDVHRVTGDVLWFVCENFTLTEWVYDGNGGTTQRITPNSVTCGWTPPADPSTPPLTCDLLAATVSQAGVPGNTTLTAGITGLSNGPLRYRLNGGVEQVSPTFTGVGPGSHTILVRDTGLAGCDRSVTVEVAPLDVPAGASAGIDLVGQPLWFTRQVAAGAEVLLHLWAESTHGAADYALVHSLRKRADASGQVAFRLDTLLWPQLRAFEVPMPAATTRCRVNLVNYFVQTQVLRTPGAALATGALRTALRGGLPAEWRGTDYFAWRLEGPQPPFLTWQPTGGGSVAGLAKPITATQPEWLFWLSSAGVPAQVQVRRSYTVGGALTVQLEALALPDSRGPAGQLLAIPVQAGAVAGAKQLSVVVETLAGAALSPVAKFELVAATAHSRYLVFTNSLGTVDTLRCEGRLEATLEAKSEQVEVPARYGATSPADQQTFGISAARKLRLPTGWLEAPELDWLQELVLTREAWLLDSRLGLLPLDLTKRTLNYYSDRPGLRGLLLECDYAFAPTAYARF